MTEAGSDSSSVVAAAPGNSAGLLPAFGAATTSGAATLGAGQLLGHAMVGAVPLALGVAVTALLVVGQNHDAEASRTRKIARGLRGLDGAGLASYVTDLAERDGVTVAGREVHEDGSTDLSARLADGREVLIRVSAGGRPDVEAEIAAFASVPREGRPILLWATSSQVPAGSVQARRHGIAVLDRDRLASWRHGVVPLPISRARAVPAAG